MPDIDEFLGRDPEPQPDWLCTDEPPRFDRKEFFKSRTVYYPGSGNDGQPVKLCALSHAAHTFIYVDLAVSWNTLSERLVDPNQCFRGYELTHHEKVTRKDLRPGGWTSYIRKKEALRAKKLRKDFQAEFMRPFAHFAVLDRHQDRDEKHGPQRLAILFIEGDGFASYDALYCQGDKTPPPFLAVIHDHGIKFGRLDRGGLLEEISRDARVLPRFQLVAECSSAWYGYADTGANVITKHRGWDPRRLFSLVETEFSGYDVPK